MEKEIVEIKTISFRSFCDMLKQYLGTDYNKFKTEIESEELGELKLKKTLKTYENWRKNNKYHELYDNEYRQLYALFDLLCVRKKKNPKEVIIKGFALPDVCKDKSLDELKAIITVKLDECYDSSNRPRFRSRKTLGTREMTQAISFLEECRKKKNDIKKIRISFQSGWNWLKTFEDRYAFLISLDELNIPIQILVNDQDSAGIIAASMTNPEKMDFYESINNAIEKWNKTTSNLKNFEFRVSNLPILRKAYIIEYKNHDLEALVRHYVYKLYTDYEYANMRLDTDDMYIRFFKNEFDFLWDEAVSYDQWSIMHQQRKEELPVGEYLLLHLKSQNDNSMKVSPEKGFVISVLNIYERNKVNLKFNIQYRNTWKLTAGEADDNYFGSVDVTRNNLFLDLKNASGEALFLTFKRPARNVDENSRYLGIMTNLNSQAYPSALKCVCLKQRDSLSENEWKKLKDVLLGVNMNDSINVLTFDTDTIETFDSRRFI